MSVLTLCVLLGVTAVHGKDTDEKKAARVKAGLVYHLAGLTQWPDGRFETNTTPITVAVLGDDPHGFADYFSSQSANVTAQGRRFVVQKLSFRGAGRGKADIAPSLKRQASKRPRCGPAAKARA